MQPAFQAFAELCETLAATPGRLDKRAQIAAYLSRLELESAEIAVLYLSGKIFPESSTLALQVGGSLLQRALLACSGVSPATLSAAYRKFGDLGSAAREIMAASSSKAKFLSLQEVSIQLEQIASAASSKTRLIRMIPFLRLLSPLETKYVVKLMLGDMRIGVQQSLVEEAIGAATEEDAVAIRRAVMLTGNLQLVLRLARQHQLHTARMQLFHPLGFMLASPAASAADAIQNACMRTAKRKFEPEDSSSAATDAELQMEDKYDGVRAQIHCGDLNQPGKVRIFSRTGDDITGSFPELEFAFRAVAKSAIIDGEILAWDHAGNRALSFAALQTRLGRKQVSAALQQATPVLFMAFDLLFCGGDLLLDTPLMERRRQLVEFIEEVGALAVVPESIPAQHSLFAIDAIEAQMISVPRLLLAPALAADSRALSVEALDAAYEAARMRGNEGLMLKASDSIYQPGRRGKAWLKLKRELATLDVVITAVEYGHGKRAKVLSDYTFAVRDGEHLRNVGKAYSGLTDAEIAQLTGWFLEHQIADQGRTLLVQPEIVLEIAFNNVMRSTRHDSGFALRFPRIVRLRPEKPAAEIDTLAAVESIYNSQPEHLTEAVE